MSELQDILIRLRNQESIKKIKREIRRHRTVIRKVKKMAADNNWLNPDSPLPEERDLLTAYQALQPGSQTVKAHPLNRFDEDITRWVAEKYSYTVMHTLISESYYCSESTVRRYVQKNHLPKIKPVYLREHEPGEVMEVDFGYIGVCWDSVTKRRRKTWFFSARLCYSRKAYREVVFDQHQETFFNCHIHAFNYFGGVPKKVRPDNLKAAIIKAAWESPLVNRAYRELATHYGFLISPCLPYHPEHKGGVENDVKYVKGNFLPIFKEKQRQLGKSQIDARELQSALSKWDREVADIRVIKKVGHQPIELFEQYEKEVLSVLPAERWDPVTCKEASVGPDFRIQFNKAFYSVPYKYIGHKVTVIANSRLVRVFDKEFYEITVHERAKKLWEKRLRPEHAPEYIVTYLNNNTDYLVKKAQKMGEYVQAMAEHLISDKAVDGIRPLRGLLRLAEKYGSRRLEAACERAFYYDTPAYQSVKRILKNNLDQKSLDEPIDPTGQRHFRFQRNKGYFDPYYENTNQGGKEWMN